MDGIKLSEEQSLGLEIGSCCEGSLVANESADKYLLYQQTKTIKSILGIFNTYTPTIPCYIMSGDSVGLAVGGGASAQTLVVESQKPDRHCRLASHVSPSATLGVQEKLAVSQKFSSGLAPHSSKSVLQN